MSKRYFLDEDEAIRRMEASMREQEALIDPNSPAAIHIRLVNPVLLVYSRLMIREINRGSTNKDAVVSAVGIITNIMLTVVGGQHPDENEEAANLRRLAMWNYINANVANYLQAAMQSGYYSKGSMEGKVPMTPEVCGTG